MRVTEFGGLFQAREADGEWLGRSSARPSDDGLTARTNVSDIQADEIEATDSVGNTTGTAATLAIGASTNGWVNTLGDDDWYAVTMVAGQSYSFSLTSGTLPDAYLEIYNSAGVLIGFDDDFGPNANSLLRWTATETGTYYINARAFEEDTGPEYTGSYTLTAANSTPASPLDSIDYHFTQTPTNIAVWFASAGYVINQQYTASRAWTQTEINAVMAALATYTAVAPITFSVASSQTSANWTFSLADLAGNTLGFFAVGGNYAAFDPTVQGFNAGLTPGGSTWATIIHEAGHGLGLAHPHDNGAINYGVNNSEVMQGVINPFDSYGTFQMNQGVFTTMSYNDGWSAGPMGVTPTFASGAQSTPMALDVALIQQRYGVNGTTNSGSTTYTLLGTNSSYIAIWDTSGTDTLSYDGSASVFIDLRAATLLNQVGGGGFVSYVSGVHGGFTIANGVVIENAMGGNAADTLIGNAANNTLDGGAGVDTMIGGAGNDTYFVDDANDVVVEALNEGTDSISTALSYNLATNVENLTFTGSANLNGAGNGAANTITGNSGSNYIDGGAGNDVLVGLAGVDTLVGGLGSDHMTGGLDGDVYYVDSNGDVVVELPGEGFDWIFTSVSLTVSANVEGMVLLESGGAINAGGSAVDNVIQGNNFDNGLDGSAGTDTLYGMGGNDTLFGGGLDNLFGGTGNDLYIVDNPGTNITELASEGYDWVFTTTSYNLPSQVEGMVLNASAGAINAGGNAQDNYIQGNDADNGLDGSAGTDTLVGLGGNDTLFGGGLDNLIGGTGNDVYIVDNPGTNITELAGEGYDWIFTSSSFNMQAHVDGMVLQEAGGSINAGGNAQNNYIQGNSFNNGIDGGAGADTLVGFGGNDTFVFQAGQANGDVINDFVGNGAAAGDQLVFFGYGTAAQGATLTQLNATQWSINSADDLIHDVITLANGQTVHATDYFFGP